MEKAYDLIVIGAGSGGCATAKIAAEKGLSVLQVDKRKKKDIGDNLTYDTIPSFAFTEFGIPYPEGKELDIKMEKPNVFYPDRKH